MSMQEIHDAWEALSEFPTLFCLVCGMFGGMIKSMNEGWKGVGDICIKICTGGFAAIMAVNALDFVGIELSGNMQCAISGMAGAGGWDLLCWAHSLLKRSAENIMNIDRKSGTSDD